MKKLLLPFIAILLLVSCNKDEMDISGIAVSFYPTQVAQAEEEDGITYVVELQASGIIGDSPAFAEVSVNLSDDGVIFTNPPLDNNTITVSFEQDTIDSGNGPRILVLGSFEVTVLNDAIPNDYEAEFVITGTSGAINSITRSNKFILSVEDTDTAPLFEDDFESGLGQWTIINSDGNNTWTTTEFGGNTSALSSTFNSGDPAREDNWLISPPINFDAATSEKLNFISKTRFNSEENRLEVSVLTNYDGVSDPTTATQLILNPTLDPHTGGGFGDFTESGDLDLTSVTGTGYIAFRFKAVNAQDASGWEVDDVEVSIFEPDASGGGTENVRSIPFSEEFENCTQDFAVPTGFNVFYAAGSKSDRGWGCRQEGVDGSRAVRVNTFGGDAGISDTWLITENKYDLTTTSSAILSFDVQSAGGGDGDLEVYYSNNFFGVFGLGTWNELDVANQLPAKGSATYSTVETTIPGGNVVYLAFRFSGSTESSSASYDIDNILLEDGCRNVNVGTPVAAITIPYTEDFESGGLGAWNIYNPDGNNTWGTTSFDGNISALVSGFESANVAAEDNWLISGQIDFDAQTGEELNLVTKGRFNFEGNQLEVYVLDGYDGVCDSNSRTRLSLALDPLSGSGFGTFTASGAIDLSSFTGTGYLAFRYVTRNADDESGWEIDDITITSD